MWILSGRGEEYVDPVWERWKMPGRREPMSSVFIGAESWHEAEVIRRWSKWEEGGREEMRRRMRERRRRGGGGREEEQRSCCTS